MVELSMTVADAESAAAAAAVAVAVRYFDTSDEYDDVGVDADVDDDGARMRSCLILKSMARWREAASWLD